MVTKDGDFFEDNQRKSLNSILKTECDKLGISLQIYSDLNFLLEELKAETPELDYMRITQAVYNNIADQLSKHGLEDGLRITGIHESKISAFITEDHDVLALEFEIVLHTIYIEDSVEEEKRNPIIIVDGDGKYLMSKDEAVETRLHTIEIRWESKGGASLKKRHVFLHVGTAYIGRQPDVPYTVRRKLD
jgi:hypothetical protein